MADVKQTWSGDVSQLEKELEKLIKQNIKLEEQMAKITKESTDGAKKQKKDVDDLSLGITGLVRNLAQAATGYWSIKSAIDAVVAAERNRLELQDKSRTAQLSVADAQMSVLTNLGDVSDAGAKQFLDRVAGIAKSAKFQSQQPLLNAASSILSATGSDQELTLGILETVAPFFRGSPEDMQVFGGVLGDVMKSTGIKDPKEAMALAMSIQGQSRGEKLASFRNISPVLAGAAIGAPNADQTLVGREAAALFSAVGGALGDPEGGVTKTAVLKLIENIATATGKEGSLFDQLKKVQENPQLQDDFREFEGQAKLLMRELVSNPDSKINRAVQDAFGKITADPTMVDRKVGQFDSLTGAIQTRTTTSKFAEAQERFSLKGKTSDIIAKEEFEKAVSAAQYPFFDFYASAEAAAVRAQGMVQGWSPELTITEIERMRGDVKRNISDPQEQARVLEFMAEQVALLRELVAQSQNGNQPDHRGVPPGLPPEGR